MKRYAINYLGSAGFDYESVDGDYVLYDDAEKIRMNVDEYLLNQIGLNDLQRQQAMDCIFKDCLTIEDK